MLTFFTDWISRTQSPIYPRKVITSESNAIALIEGSRCYGKQFDCATIVANQVKIYLKELSDNRHFFHITQMQAIPFEGKILHQHSLRGSFEVFSEPVKIWLRWHNQIKELSLEELADTIHLFENADKYFPYDLFTELRQSTQRRIM